MKFAKRLTAAVLSCLLLLSLAACDTPEPPQPTEPALPPTEVYDTAKAQLLAAPNRIMTYTATTNRFVSSTTYTEAVAGTASISAVGTDDMVAIVEENLKYGTLSATQLLSFCNGRAYNRISGSTFGADMTAEDFLAAQLPAALLDASLYGNLAYRTHADGVGILFTQPNALESWVNAPEGAVLISASGLAILDSAGALVQTDYTAEYSCGDTRYSLQITLKCATPAQLELDLVHPEHPEEYTELTCLDAPKLLLRAADDILSAQKLTASVQENIFCEMIPLTRTRASEMHIWGQQENLVAKLSNIVTVTDYREQPDTTKQVYDFLNGVCSITTNDGTPTVESGITAQTMRTSMEDSLLSALFATRYLADATLTEEEDYYRLDFVGNEAYCNDLIRDLSAFLQLSLEDITSHRDTVASGYLCIDKTSGLPVAMGMYFTRTHISGDVPYEMTYQLDQTIDLSPAE